MEKKTGTKVLPAIPEKRCFTIGEVSDLCHLKSHVLRYWEQVFPELNPAKRRGNRRYYTQDDILLIRKIRDLLYCQGFTINGAKQALKVDSKESDQVTEKNDLLTGLIANLNKVLVELE